MYEACSNPATQGIGDDVDDVYKYGDSYTYKTRLSTIKKYHCIKNVLYRYFELFQPKNADVYKKNLDTYLNAYDTIADDIYSVSCECNCGNITADYVASDRLEMIKNLYQQYVKEAEFELKAE